MNETIRLILVLTVICSISSALLATVYRQTQAPIEATLRQRTLRAAAQVLPEGAPPPVPVEQDGTTFYVTRRDGAFAGAALEGRSANGYGGEMVLMVGVGADGKLVTFQKLVASETPGLGTKIETDAFRRPLLGRSIQANWTVRKDGGEIDAVTAATISSRAALECIRDAIARFEKALPSLTAAPSDR
ncbi:MAG: RnfABCDGE type electron transport complex subunit G [Kiritimatiellia bacterium]|jgi:electron transport complex protein RnfG|nr:RnfABCDGE type electron transport complex subunit G [Kiritimatiellia bacterium]